MLATFKNVLFPGQNHLLPITIPVLMTWHFNYHFITNLEKFPSKIMKIEVKKQKQKKTHKKTTNKQKKNNNKQHPFYFARSIILTYFLKNFLKHIMTYHYYL